MVLSGKSWFAWDTADSPTVPAIRNDHILFCTKYLLMFLWLSLVLLFCSRNWNDHRSWSIRLERGPEMRKKKRGPEMRAPTAVEPDLSSPEATWEVEQRVKTGTYMFNSKVVTRFFLLPFPKLITVCPSCFDVSDVISGFLKAFCSRGVWHCPPRDIKFLGAVFRQLKSPRD